MRENPLTTYVNALRPIELWARSDDEVLRLNSFIEQDGVPWYATMALGDMLGHHCIRRNWSRFVIVDTRLVSRETLASYLDDPLGYPPPVNGIGVITANWSAS